MYWRSRERWRFSSGSPGGEGVPATAGKVNLVTPFRVDPQRLRRISLTMVVGIKLKHSSTTNKKCVGTSSDDGHEIPRNVRQIERQLGSSSANIVLQPFPFLNNDLTIALVNRWRDLMTRHLLHWINFLVYTAGLGMKAGPVPWRLWLLSLPLMKKMKSGNSSSIDSRGTHGRRGARPKVRRVI